MKTDDGLSPDTGPREEDPPAADLVPLITPDDDRHTLHRQAQALDTWFGKLLDDATATSTETPPDDPDARPDPNDMYAYFIDRVLQKTRSANEPVDERTQERRMLLALRLQRQCVETIRTLHAIDYMQSLRPVPGVLNTIPPAALCDERTIKET